MRRGGSQPYAKGAARQPGPALDAMRRGQPAHGRHPSAVKRALQKRHTVARKTALGRAFAKRGR